MKKKTKKKSSGLFNEIKDKAYVDVYGNENHTSIDISWSLKNVGFGHLVIYYDKELQELRTDTEQMSPKLIEKILILAAPKLAKELIELDTAR